jgi:hypothetical protein
MPIYVYRNKITDKQVEIIQSIAEQHVYHGSSGDESGQWERVFTVPQMSVDAKVDPHDEKKFARQTSTKKETLGDIFDRSKEASDKREQKDGRDPIKEKFYENYSKRRPGHKHPDQVNREKKEKLKKLGVDLS